MCSGTGRLFIDSAKGNWASETDSQCQAKVITVVVSGVRRLSTAVRPEAQNMEIFELILNQVKRRRRANNEEKKGGMRLTSIKLKRQFKIYNLSKVLGGNVYFFAGLCFFYDYIDYIV